MKALKLVKPFLPVAVTDGGGATLSNLAALLTPDPREVANAAGPTNVYIVDFGAPIALDTIYAGYNTYGDDAYVDAVIMSNINGTWGAACYVGYSGDNSLSVTPPTAGPAWRHGVIQLANPVVGRYMYFRTKGAGMLGVIAAGLSFTARFGIEYGAGRQITDTSVVDRLLSGTFAIDPGAVASGYSWTFGDLSASERHALFDIVRRCGVGNPILVMEDPDFTYDALTAQANVAITGSGKIVTKSGSGAAYDASAYTTPRSGSIGATFKVANAPGGVLGLSLTPNNSSLFTDINYGVNINGGGIQAYYGAANHAVASAGVAVGDRIGIYYDERFFSITQNGVVIDTQVSAAGQSLGFDMSISASGSQYSDINVFGLGYDARIHWGLFQKLDAYERLDPSNTKWSLIVSDWA